MAKGQKTIYKNSAVILRLVLGILSIVISAVVGFQSWAAIFAFANLSENFGDLVVWAVLSVIFAVVLVITLFLKEKDSSDETTKE